MKYTKNENAKDILWNHFLDDVRNGEIDFDKKYSEELKKPKIDLSSLPVMTEDEFENIRLLTVETLKKYRTADEELKKSINSLMGAHAIYSRERGTPKWKRVNNILVYRYMTITPMTVRMIASKTGRCKEETDNDLMSGQKNLTVLVAGYPALLQQADNSYDMVWSILKNYMLLKESVGVDATDLFPDHMKPIIKKYKNSTKEIMKRFESALLLLKIFCNGSSETEERRIDVLMKKYIEERASTPETAKKYNVGKSTVQYDNMISVKRIGSIMFQ